MADERTDEAAAPTLSRRDSAEAKVPASRAVSSDCATVRRCSRFFASPGASAPLPRRPRRWRQARTARRGRRRKGRVAPSSWTPGRVGIAAGVGVAVAIAVAVAAVAAVPRRARRELTELALACSAYLAPRWTARRALTFCSWLSRLSRLPSSSGSCEALEALDRVHQQADVRNLRRIFTSTSSRPFSAAAAGPTPARYSPPSRPTRRRTRNRNRNRRRHCRRFRRCRC